MCAVAAIICMTKCIILTVELHSAAHGSHPASLTHFPSLIPPMPLMNAPVCCCLCRLTAVAITITVAIATLLVIDTMMVMVDVTWRWWSK